jgi:alpha-tubulin suppressor-like RCC1 family protein
MRTIVWSCLASTLGMRWRRLELSGAAPTFSRASRSLAVVAIVIAALSVTLVASGATPPAPVVSGIAAGNHHACAIVGNFDGAVCWGTNYSGELGNGSRPRAASTPVALAGLASGVKAISAGAYHTCALTRAGGVKCWGYNRSGQLGNGSTVNSRVPVDVRGLTSGVKAVAAGWEHTCAITRGGEVKCWGFAAHGQLGRRLTDPTFSTTPVVVRGFGSPVVAISAGYQHTCALTFEGGVKCWGEYWLGDPTRTFSLKPVAVVGLTRGVKAIAVGPSHTCALTSNGGVKCWGKNTRGELGDGSQRESAVPVDVVGLASGVKAITAGGGGNSPDLADSHTCALTSGGGVKCWGDNLSGELGDGSHDESAVPVDVVGLASGVKAIAASAGDNYTCASMTKGGAKCWGDNSQGRQLGNGSKAISSPTPVDVLVPFLQAIFLKASTPAGSIARGSVVTFTATAQPLRPTGNSATIRFEVYQQVGGVWRLVARRNSTADARGEATLPWTFSAPGSWYVRAMANASWPYAASPWSGPIRYSVG